MTASRSALAMAAVVALACSEVPPVANTASGHPVPGGQWPPTVGDRWPASLQAAFDFTGCAAYGGIVVRTAVQAPPIEQVQGVAGLDLDGHPVIIINPSMLTAEALSRSFLYLHECAHHRLQHPALSAAGTPVDPVEREYAANCEAAAYALTATLLDRRDIDFLLLVLENNSGPERPPGQRRELVSCLEDRGLY